jgi:hypothetical protein
MKNLLDKYKNVISEGNDLEEIKKIYKVYINLTKFNHFILL